MHISKAQIKLVRGLQQKKQRELSGMFVAEGEKCIIELQKRYPLHLLIAEEGYVWRFGQQQALEASEMEIGQMSSLRTPQGLIGVFRMLDSNNSIPADEELILALDGVQDPGNMGTIIRTADWFGIRHIICSPDTADCYNPKVVQATMGALARVSITNHSLPEYLDHLRTISTTTPIYGTLLEGRNMYEPGSVPNRNCGVILLGNEGNGLSPEVRQRITHPLRIPSFPANSETSESLNVAIAGAVVLSYFRQQA